MDRIYSEAIGLRACNCDLHGEWRPSAILEAMQETATTHSDRLGIGRALTDGLGIAWVLSRTRVDLGRVPRLGESVTVQTWPLPPKHLFWPRMHAFLDADGRQIGSASSLWVLMDLQTRRVVASEPVRSRLPDNADLPGGMPAPGKPPEAGAVPGALLPPYGDFDVNGHVNNTRYLDWTCNALGIGVLAEWRVCAFSVSYEQEILPGAEVRTALAHKDDRFAFTGTIGDRRCFSVIGEMERRS